MELHTHGLSGHLNFDPPDREGWRRCHVQVSVPGFNAGFVCAVEQAELKHLRDELVRLLACVGDEAAMEWSAMEMGISLSLALRPTGEIRGRYEFRSDPDGPTLKGRFSPDQTYLRHWIGDINIALEVRG